MSGTSVSDVKVGGRRLRAGDVVKVAGLRGEFSITGMNDRGGTADGGTPNVEVTVYGGPRAGVRMYRTVTLDRIGTRKALANAESMGPVH